MTWLICCTRSLIARSIYHLIIIVLDVFIGSFQPVVCRFSIRPFSFLAGRTNWLSPIHRHSAQFFPNTDRHNSLHACWRSRFLLFPQVICRPQTAVYFWTITYISYRLFVLCGDDESIINTFLILNRYSFPFSLPGYYIIAACTSIYIKSTTNGRRRSL